ncbi:hypothetical protein BaOVIS_012880 [Babesia ovis]|uniref:Uncharacterized protein n=1 Tax=Babesia ovis TaxID=5869 RepID=A0A9W5T9C3_BABOV|nr:hypothetical protein BaOVIS_012880 [Babesia ovis]
MREDVLFVLSRLVPRRTATVYFLLFGATLLLSIGLLNGSENLFRRFTSCQGNADYGISAFTALVVLQCLLLLPKFDDPIADEPSDSDSHTAPSTFSHLDNHGNILTAKKLRDAARMPHREFFRSEGFVGIVCDKSTPSASSGAIHSYDSNISLIQSRAARRKLHSEGFITDLAAMRPSRLDSVATIKEGDDSPLSSTEDNNEDERFPDSPEQKSSFCVSWVGSKTICWNSLWMLLYHLVIFMGIHATLLASRIHGTIAINEYALETCSHLRDKFPLGMWSPRLGHQLISESTFFLTYMSCTTFELITRKSSDASYVKNFFSFHFLREQKFIGVTRILLQGVIFIYAISQIIISMLTGYGSPMQIVCGFSMGMLMLSINAVLTQLLELSDMSKSTMNLNWFWSLLSLLNFWICSVLFYISVYGLPLTAPYIYLQFFAWIPLLILTTRKGRHIFMWQNISSALYAFN